MAVPGAGTAMTSVDLPSTEPAAHMRDEITPSHGHATADQLVFTILETSGISFTFLGFAAPGENRGQARAPKNWRGRERPEAPSGLHPLDNDPIKLNRIIV